MKWHIVLGIFSMLGVIFLMGVVAIQEPERMDDFTQAYDSRQIEVGASLFENNCRSCHGPQGRGIEGVAPSLNEADFFNGQRAAAVGYTGTLPDYIRGVLVSGRPVPSEGTNYPQRMPNWAQSTGGPMRDDQIEALVSFVLNWETQALAEAGEIPPTPSGDFIGTDVAAIAAGLPEGDPEAGKQLSDGLGCSGCHILAAVGPSWEAEGDLPGLGERSDLRLSEAGYTGSATSPEEYLIELVVRPNDFVNSGYDSNIMVPNFGERLTLQEMADLVAYMLSFR